MLNILTLVGRLVSDPKIIETENEKKVCEITLAVPRSYKNADGIYETDFISVTLWAGIVEQVCEYCHKGDLVGVKGRIKSNVVADDNEHYDTSISEKLELIADKVIFLSPKTKKEE